MVLLITLPNEYTDRGRILSLADFLNLHVPYLPYRYLKRASLVSLITSAKSDVDIYISR
jgi:hypothetical protein